MKKFIFRHREIVGACATVFALGVAVLYLFVVPLDPAAEHPLVWAILRYGHSLCWLLLAGAAGLFAANATPRIVSLLAYMALISYGVFIVTYVASIMT